MMDSVTGSGRQDPAVNVSTLLGDDHEEFNSVLSGERARPVAVVGDPDALPQPNLDEWTHPSLLVASQQVNVVASG